MFLSTLTRQHTLPLVMHSAILSVSYYNASHAKKGMPTFQRMAIFETVSLSDASGGFITLYRSAKKHPSNVSVEPIGLKFIYCSFFALVWGNANFRIC